jgi:hypothetical protein
VVTVKFFWIFLATSRERFVEIMLQIIETSLRWPLEIACPLAGEF